MTEHVEHIDDDRPLAVMDVGTRAARLLIWRGGSRSGDGAFNFGDYQNWGQQTGAASGLVATADGRMHYHLPDFAETLRFLRQAVRRCRQEGIDRERLVMVGTELFRRIDNAAALQDLVRQETGVELLILTPEEEATTSFCSVLHACRPFYIEGESLLIMEVGGGSMQLGVAPATVSATPPRVACFPELGTVLLRRRFLGEEHEEGIADSDLELLLRNGSDYMQERLSEKLEALSAVSDLTPTRAFALGNAVSELARCRGGNGRMHGVEVGLEELDAGVEWNRPVTPAGRLETGYGLAGYAHVLRHFGLPAMTVCGAGLRYGVCFRLRRGQWTGLRLHAPVS